MARFSQIAPIIAVGTAGVVLIALVVYILPPAGPVSCVGCGGMSPGLSIYSTGPLPNGTTFQPLRNYSGLLGVEWSPSCSYQLDFTAHREDAINRTLSFSTTAAGPVPPAGTATVSPVAFSVAAFSSAPLWIIVTCSATWPGTVPNETYAFSLVFVEGGVQVNVAVVGWFLPPGTL